MCGCDEEWLCGFCVKVTDALAAEAILLLFGSRRIIVEVFFPASSRVSGEYSRE